MFNFIKEILLSRCDNFIFSTGPPLKLIALLIIRNIQAADNRTLARIVRDTLTEFDAAKPGTVYFDPTTDNLYELFQQPGSIYFVAELDNMIAGGAGIFPTEGLPSGVCELVKTYLVPSARGKGIGKMLIEKCLAAAREMGYEKIYLESMPELQKALAVYERAGFTYLDRPLGNSGHFGCDRYMIRETEMGV
jgi:putative acetyltransferase